MARSSFPGERILPGKAFRNVKGSRYLFVKPEMDRTSEEAGTILLVEDEPKVARALEKGLQGEGYRVDLASRGDQGLAMAREGEYDLLVLDLMLPGMEGLEVLRVLREEGWANKVLILTARDTVEDRVLGLDSGADDYLVKPFAFAELLARVRALLRRGEPVAHRLLRVGDLELDLSARKASLAGEPVELTRREFDLLAFFVKNRDRVVTREMLVRRVWKEAPTSIPMDNVIDVYVHRLRKKVGGGGGESLIRTVRGVGFILEGGEA